MAHLHAAAELAPDTCHHVVRGHARGLCDQQHAVRGHGAGQSWAPTSLRSRSISSGSSMSVVKPAAWRCPPPPNLRAIAGHVHPAVGGAQAHLAPPVVREQLAHQAGDEGSLDLAHVVDDALRVALVGAGAREVVDRQVGDGQRAAVEALHGAQRTREELDAAERQALVQALVDHLRLDAGRDQLRGHHVRGGCGVLEHELARVGDQRDVERLRERLGDLDVQLAGQGVDDLGGARGVPLDQVHVAEARVVVVVVDVHDAHAGAAQELDRHAVDVAAVEEDDQALLEVGRRLAEDVVERHVPVLARQRELVLRHEHHRVLAELLEDELHRAQRAQRVAVRVLVRRQEELVGGAELVQDLLVLGATLTGRRPSRPARLRRSACGYASPSRRTRRARTTAWASA